MPLTPYPLFHRCFALPQPPLARAARARRTRACCVLLFHSAGQPTHSERFPTSVSAVISHPRTRARARSERTLVQRAASWECSLREDFTAPAVLRPAPPLLRGCPPSSPRVRCGVVAKSARAPGREARSSSQRSAGHGERGPGTTRDRGTGVRGWALSSSHPLALPGHGGSWRRAVGVCREPASLCATAPAAVSRACIPCVTPARPPRSCNGECAWRRGQ